MHIKKPPFLFLGTLVGVCAFIALVSSPSLSLSTRPGNIIKPGDIKMVPERIKVIDGDSFQFDGKIYDVAYVDAPEIGQVCKQGKHLWHCGLDAAFTLRKIFELEGETMTCALTHDNEKTRADCITGTMDLSEHLLLEGLVTVADNAPQPYRIAEEKARDASLGIWRGEFIPPAKWRAGDRLPEEHKHDPNAPLLQDLPWHFSAGQLTYDPETQHLSCIVKGVVNPDGKKIYYTPLDNVYPNIRIDQDKGDTVFCGDEHARASGFHHPGERAEKATGLN